MINNYSISLNAKTANKKPNTVSNHTEDCPFCDWTSIIKEELMLENKQEMSWVKNKFPILDDTYQTLILETTKCGESLATYSLEYAKKLFKFIFECREKMIKSGEYKEVIFFKNHGVHSDSSIKHSHSQLVGLTKHTYDYKEIEKSIDGPVVYENKDLKVTVSQIPRHEFYEFNVVWNEDENEEYVEWIQILIKFLDEFKNGKYESYNLLYHETKQMKIIKVVPRKPVSIYYVGYGLKQTPNDTLEIANEIKKYAKKY